MEELERPAFLRMLTSDPDHRVARVATQSADRWNARAKAQGTAQRRERRFEERLEALRKQYGKAVAGEVQELAFQRLATVAEQVGHDLLGTVSTLHRVENTLRRYLDEEQIGKADWDLSVGSLPRITNYLKSFAEDFREFLAAPAVREFVTVQDLVRSAVTDAKAAIEPSPHANVEQTVGPSLRAEVPVGDLCRCVANLVKNALEATASTGRVNVKVWAEGADLRIRVQDNGRGMSDDMKRRCFEPFQTTKKAHEARPSGLGLAIVKRKIEEQLGGYVRVESQLGKGSTFTLEIPGVVRL